MALRVSDLAAEVGVTTDAIRFYEREGLLPPPERTSSGYRQFHEAAVRRVRFIKGALSLGLKLAEIRELRSLRADLNSLKQLECLASETAVDGSWPCEIEFVKRGGE